MTAYIIRRLLLIVPTLIGIMIINFAVVQIVPGGPVEQMIAQMTGTAVESTARFSGNNESESLNNYDTNNFDSKYRSVTKSLFDNNYITALDIRKRKSIETLKMCTEKCSRKYKEYLEDMIKVIQEYDDLPGGYLKRINRISKKTAEKEVEELTKEITHEYISKSFEKADRIDQEKEHIIISEELSNA